MIAVSVTHARFRLVAIVAYALVALIVARLAVATHSAGTTGAMLFLAVSPMLLYAAIRAPMIFPFGAYVFLVPFDNLLQLGGGGGTLARVTALASAAALILHILLKRRLLMPPRSWVRWGLVLLWMTATATWTYDAAGTQLVLAAMVQLFLLLTVLAVYPIAVKELQAVLAIVAASGTVAALYGLELYVTGLHMGSDTGRTTLADANGNFVDPNHYAASLLLPAALAIAYFFSSRRFAQRALSGGAIGAILVGLLLSGSRDGLGAFLFSLGWLAVRLKRVKAMVGLLICGLVGSIFIPTIWQRIADPGQGEAGGRFEIWRIGLAALKDHFVVGSGIGSFPAMYDHYFLTTYSRRFELWSRPSHNLLLGTAVEEGFIGLAFVLVAWWTSFRQNADGSRESPWFPARIATEAAFVGLFVAALFVDMLWFKYLWLVLGIAILLRNVEEPRVLWPAVGPAPVTAPPPSALERLRRPRPPRLG